jgi:ABC-type lipoprotein export system ATPase subunit
MIHLEEVTKLYPTPHGSVSALGGVSLDVAPGEFVAVRGPSGCGKSTLLTIIGSLGMPTSGRVVVAGEDLVNASPGARARFRAERLGFVFQTFHLLPYLTVRENVVAAALPGSRATVDARADELLCQFGLADRRQHRPAELSTGECQRVAVARAMINQPQLILADEPTGNLDADNSAAVLELLADYQRQGGTVLLVTHQESAARYAQRTVLLHQGKIDEKG